MRRDHRLSRMLHVLIHMDQHEEALTSDNIGTMLETSPAVVRRTMAGLRDHGLVTSEKGHGGGWWLARELSEISILDIYEAIGEPTLFAFGPANENPECLVEKVVDDHLGEAFREAAEALRERLSATTLDEIRHDFEIRLKGSQKKKKRR